MGSKRFAGYLRIPEQTEGEWAIKRETKPAGWTAQTANMRTSLFGDRGRSVTFEHETTWHYLTEGNGVWMSDLPIEQAQHDRLLRNVEGHVLIGGLGLGYSAQMLARRKRVAHVTVIEKSPEVVKMVAEHLRVPAGKLTVVCADLFDWLDVHRYDDPMDWAFYDIWQSDGEGTLHDVVLPLLRKSVGLVDPDHVLCWNENIMRGQLRQALWTRATLDMLHAVNAAQGKTLNLPTRADFREEIGDKYHDWCVPFFRWLGDRELTVGVEVAITTYAGAWGRPGWEERWRAFVKESE